MLDHLHIENFGLIEKISLDFQKGLNVLTGETGAGKSILIEALRFALGARPSASLLRIPDLPCRVEAVFEITPAIRDIITGMDDMFEDEESLIIRRSFSPEGRNRIKVNGMNYTVTQLRTLGDLLVDFHGPHDHQMLLSENFHLRILDRLSDHEKEYADYIEAFGEYSRLAGKAAELEELSGNRDRELDLISHQVNELEQVPLDDDSYEKAQQESRRVNNTERLAGNIRTILQVLDGDRGISSLAQQAFPPMRELVDIDPDSADLMEPLDNIQSNTDCLLSSLSSLLEDLSYEPGEAASINARCDAYFEILRKYGPSMDDARTFYNELKEKHSTLLDIEHNEKDLDNKLRTAEKKLLSLGKRLSKRRRTAGVLLEETIESELGELGFTDVNFECDISTTSPSKDGTDKVAFLISPNKGEALKPLAEIVSSGEAARVMLALKKALTKADPVPVLIFDEIDAQIGGRLGAITGKKLRELSRDRQVLLITHLPQIASFGVRHFKITKEVSNGKTFTRTRILEKNERVKELSQMMSGSASTAISLKHAHDMLEQASDR